MEHVGIDLHKKHSQVCVLNELGQEVLSERIPTRRSRFAELFGDRPRSRILLESSTESEWVAQLLEQLGHEVMVVDPNFALTYATRNPRIKTDVRDARALADACMHGHFKRAHRMSPEARLQRIWLGNRERLVGTRTKLINRVRAVLRQFGIALPTCATESIPRELRKLVLAPELREALVPMVDALYGLNDQIDSCDRKLEELGAAEPVVKTLRSAPGVGAVTALAFVAVVDGAARFKNGASLANYLGLTPAMSESGTVRSERKGAHITKRGNRMLRWLLVEAGHRILRGGGGAGSEELRRWGQQVKARRGTGVAAVALGRKLACLLYAMWRDDARFDAAARATSKAVA